MPKSTLGNTKEARPAVLADFEKREDMKLYGELPYYDDPQRYDLGKDGISRQIALRIYDNPHRPSWQTLKHHLFAVKSQKHI